MSREQNVELFRLAWEAFRGRDVDAWVGCFDPGAELFLPRNVLEGGSYRGLDEIGQALEDAFDMWEEFRFDLQHMLASDDYVVALGRSTNVGKGAAPTVEFESAFVVKIRAGKIAYLRPYQSHGAALEAIGLAR
jgi:ketosteroid isomerase-like protein